MTEVRPEETFTFEKKVGVAETTIFQVPAEVYERKIYAIVLSNLSASVNTITLRQYASDGTTLEKEWGFSLAGNTTIPLLNGVISPIIGVSGGKYLRAVAASDYVQVVLGCYDL